MFMENDNSRHETNPDTKKWFEELDRQNSEPFFPDRARQVTPERHVFDESTK